MPAYPDESVSLLICGIIFSLEIGWLGISSGAYKEIVEFLELMSMARILFLILHN